METQLGTNRSPFTLHMSCGVAAMSHLVKDTTLNQFRHNIILQPPCLVELKITWTVISSNPLTPIHFWMPLQQLRQLQLNNNSLISNLSCNNSILGINSRISNLRINPINKIKAQWVRQLKLMVVKEGLASLHQLHHQEEPYHQPLLLEHRPGMEDQGAILHNVIACLLLHLLRE